MEIKGYSFPEGLYYDKDHGWSKKDGELLISGVTDWFQKSAGEIIFVEVPATGRKIEAGQPYASIESGKWVGRLKAPVSGEIKEVNAEVGDFPYTLNESCYEDGWIIKIKPDNAADVDALWTLPNDAAAFEAFLTEEESKTAK